MIRTRFAPSPTGLLHIGGVRTALFCWLYARRHHGVFVLRIEDTDRERSTEEAVKVILDGMQWLGLKADEGPFYQTQRMDRYAEVLEQMVREGKAYRCYCTKEELDAMRAQQQARKEKPRYDGRCRHRSENGIDARAGVDPVVRFKNPLDGEVVVDDVIHGRVVFENRELDDLIVARSDGSPTYNFCVVVDDMDMRITHVIRGDDHLNNAPRQINMLKALGVTPPVYAHVPMILGPDGAKLSKRHGAVSVLQYREEGYLPEALLNYLVRLGWSHGDQELFTLEEMTQLFDIKDVSKSASAINPEKLQWLNQQHMMRAPLSRLAGELKWQLERIGVDPLSNLAPAGEGTQKSSVPLDMAGNKEAFARLEGIVAIQRERSKTLAEMAQASRFFFIAPHEYDEKAARKHLTPDAMALLGKFRARLDILQTWDAPTIHQTLESVCAEAGVALGKLAQPVRVAVSGGPVSPPIDATLALLGKPATLERIDAVLTKFNQERITK